MYLDILKLEKQEANKDKKPLPGDPLVNMEIVGTKIGDKSGGVFGCVRETSNNCGKFVNSEGYIKIINKNKMHDGFDLKASLFTPVYAMYDGTVEFSGDRKNALGICIYIISTPTQHKKSSYPIRITYCHLNRVLVKNRESIKQGQLIGYTGNTGNAKKILEWRYHLHLQVYNLTTGSKISPYKFLTTKFNKYNGENE
jgi:murein DD-endopeptidase MepM/ murein hydrolase activator NlpD